MEEVTKKEFEKYEELRQTGEYNMFADGYAVMTQMKMNPRHKSDINKYMSIIVNYDELKKKFNI